MVKIHLVSANDFKQITGVDAPPTPISYEEYQKSLPWYKLHDEGMKDTKGSDVFAKLKSVKGKKGKKTKI